VIVPAPPTPFNARARVWSAGQPLLRVAIDNLGSTEFANTTRPRRFAPVITLDGDNVPVLYAGSTDRCALAESTFHDVPDDISTRTQVSAARLRAMRLSTLRSEVDLRLADLTDRALPDLGVTRAELIGCGPAAYPATALWGTAAWQTGFDGVVWNSRRSPTDLSVILFAGRVDRYALVADEPLPLAPDTPNHVPGYYRVLELAAELNVTIIT
jgi:uncharacterized protein YjiS (DUF1127 family)